MVNKKILIISNYPIKDPQHGGQKRVAAIVNEYKKVFSEVRFVAIFLREHYPNYSKDDIYLTGKAAEKIKGDHLTSDIEIGKAMVDEPKFRKKIEQLLLGFQPDILQLEQAFPFIGLKEILNELNLEPKIVYSSQNIESPMRKEIMEISGANEKDIETVGLTINKVEEALVREADLVSAVSQNDADYLLSEGARNLVLAPNGVFPLRPSNSAKKYWAEYFKKNQIERVLLFVGSGHVPNVAGFKKMVGFRFGFLTHIERLILAGGAGQAIEESFDKTNMLDLPFWKRAINVGIIEQNKLEALIEFSEVILIPIVDGGGSNLKTAEAILSGKKIVATTFAFRGYESYLDLPNVWIADTQEEFVDAITEALETPLKERSDSEKLLSSNVLWEHTLNKLVREVSKL